MCAAKSWGTLLIQWNLRQRTLRIKDANVEKKTTPNRGELQRPKWSCCAIFNLRREDLLWLVAGEVQLEDRSIVDHHLIGLVSCREKSWVIMEGTLDQPAKSVEQGKQFLYVLLRILKGGWGHNKNHYSLYSPALTDCTPPLPLTYNTLSILNTFSHTHFHL